jgi:PHP family Zn ribbon phosphoesterase
MSNETNYYKINTLFLPILELRLTSSTDYANMIKENKNLDILDEKGNFSWEKL